MVSSVRENIDEQIVFKENYESVDLKYFISAQILRLHRYFDEPYDALRNLRYWIQYGCCISTIMLPATKFPQIGLEIVTRRISRSLITIM